MPPVHDDHLYEAGGQSSPRSVWPMFCLLAGLGAVFLAAFLAVYFFIEKGAGT